MQFYVASVKKIWGEAAYIVLHTKVTRSLSEPRAFLREAPVCKEAQTKTCSYSANFFTMAWQYHDMTPCQVSCFSGEFGIYKNLKTKFLNVFCQATTPRCLNFILVSCMGPKNLPKDTHVIFQPTLVHRACACRSNLNYAH